MKFFMEIQFFGEMKKLQITKSCLDLKDLSKFFKR